ncbi:MAG: polysaccharide biosynthesis protein [Holophagaceae bacterium]|nr:polysaccharide biosynthesis protein [Holophagaceae bacterium]
MPCLRMTIPMLLVASLGAQDASLIDQLKAAGQANQMGGGSNSSADVTPKNPTASPAMDTLQFQREQAEEDRLEQEIKELKTRENALPRFASDLFELRSRSTSGTEGGIADDYILGTGDRLNLNAFGSATFDLPVQVDGRGQVVVPKVGTVKVGGLSLAKAKARLQGLVQKNFSNTEVDLTVLKLREVRVFVMGEVYKPGSFLVPSLSSLVNVLSLAGGPTASGSFRQIRVMRGGKLIHALDLYPLRAEGLGNMNLSLQNGDTIFVPLAYNQVLLEGSFARVRALLPPPQTPHDATTTAKPTAAAPSEAAGQEPTSGKPLEPKALPAPALPPKTPEKPGKPTKLQFELLPGETAQEALRYAGGLTADAYPDLLSLRRQDAEGRTSVQDIPIASLAKTELQRGDVLSAFPRRDRLTQAVTVTGWTRVNGSFGRTNGLKVGELLKRDRQVLPDTYLGRGEIVRTLEDGSTRYLSFHVAKAMAGDPEHNLALEDRDRIELFKLQNLRLPKKVTISGPLTHPGTFELHDGMRVADLVFKGGIPQKDANRFYAELARTRDGKVSEVRRLDLGQLLSSEETSPLRLQDDTLNPKLQEDDQVTVYSKPQFKLHRTVQILGQVARPGSYVMDSDHFTLSQLVERAGGLTPQAMAKSGIFIRPLNSDKTTLETSAKTLGLAEVLERLNETKLYVNSTTAALGKAGEPQLFRPPVLHGLDSTQTNRLVVNFEGALRKEAQHDVELVDGDTVVIPKQTDSAIVLGEAATPFAYYKVTPGMSVSDLLTLAGGTTRNADTSQIRLLKADGRIKDSWVSWAKVEPGDALLIPQRVRRDVTWQENMTALTPLAILISAIRN